MKSLLDRFDYTYPTLLVGKTPARPRDAARLMIYRKRSKKITHETFRNIDRYIPADALLIINDTKVLPARLKCRRRTGGTVELLYVGKEKKYILMLANRRLNAGEELVVAPGISIRVVAKKGSHYLLTPPSRWSIVDLLARYGKTPLPPYLKDSPLTEGERKVEYQAVFARRIGAVAAPTASLHFTKALLQRLKGRGVTILPLTLHVGLGTFSSINDEIIRRGTLHSEYYTISPGTWTRIQDARKEGRPIIAVGTTVMRALESAYRSRTLSGFTTLFIKKGFRFRVVTDLITNFHVPRSSLLMLVSAFTGYSEMRRLYSLAIRKEYRLFSFGDAMYIRK